MTAKALYVTVRHSTCTTAFVFLLSGDLHTPAPLLMRVLIIQCTRPARQYFIFPLGADMKIMIH